MAIEKYDHEDVLIIEWIDTKIDNSIVQAIKDGVDWTPIRPFLHDHEKMDKTQCCHFNEESGERCPKEAEFVSYCARAGGCVVWCKQHKPDNIDDLPNFPQ